MSIRTPTALGLLLGLLPVDRCALPAAAQTPAGYEAPVLQSSVVLDYPAALLTEPSPPAGTIELRFVVGVDGVPREVEVTRASTPSSTPPPATPSPACATSPASSAAARSRSCSPSPSTSPLPSDPHHLSPRTYQRPRHTSDRCRDRCRDRWRPMPRPRRRPAPRRPAAAHRPRPVRRPAHADRRRLRARRPGRRRDAGRPREEARYNEPIPRLDHARRHRRRRPLRAARRALGQAPGGRAGPGPRAPRGGRAPRRRRAARARLLPPAARVQPLPHGREVAPRDSGEVDRRTISAEEISKLPGTQGDALKAIQNFPGVASAPFGAGLLVIRGAAPNDSATFLGHHEIPQLFHFGGLTSVFNADILTQIDFIPGNFDSRFGDAIGGVLNVPRARADATASTATSRATSSTPGILAEGPVGKGSLIVAGRGAATSTRSCRSSCPRTPASTSPSRRATTTIRSSSTTRSPAANLSARVFGSDDRSKLLFASAPTTPTRPTTPASRPSQFFHRADLVYRKQLGPWEFLVTPSYRRDDLSFAITDAFRFHVVSDTFSGRAEVSRQLSRTRRPARRHRVRRHRLRPQRHRRPSPSGGSADPAPQSTSRPAAPRPLRHHHPAPRRQAVTLFPGAAPHLLRRALHPRHGRAAPAPRRGTSPTTPPQGRRRPLRPGGAAARVRRRLRQPARRPRARAAHQPRRRAGLPRDITIEVTGFYKTSGPRAPLGRTPSCRRPACAPRSRCSRTRSRGYVVGGELLLRKAADPQGVRVAQLHADAQRAPRRAGRADTCSTSTRPTS
jgi:hypothetical protein